MFSHWLITDSYEKKQESLTFEAAENAMKYARELLDNSGEITKTTNGLVAGTTPLQNSTFIVNKVKDLTGFGCTIFEGDIRISTTASAIGSDEIAIGTSSSKTIAKQVYGLGETFKGVTETIGKDWLIIYEPLRDDTGKLVGMIAVFKEYKNFLSDLSDFKILVTITIFVFVLLVFILIWRTVSRTNKLELARKSCALKNSQLKDQKKDLENLIFVVGEIEQTIAIIDKNDRIVWVNKSFEKTLQYRSDEVIGKKASDMLSGPETDRVEFQKMDEAIFTWGRAIDSTIRQYRKDGSSYWAKLYLTPLLDEDEEVDRYVAISLDISEEKLAREQLQESERNIRKIGETIDDTVYLYNLIYDRFEYISPKCNAVLGANQNFFYSGQNYENLFVLDKYKSIIKKAREAVGEGKSFDIEYEIEFENSTRWIRERSHPIHDDNGRVVKNSGVFSDITESKNLQSELTRKNEHFKLLTEIGMDLTQDLSIVQIIETVHACVSNIMESHSFAIGILDKENNRLHFPKFIENNKIYNDIYHSLDEHILATICVKDKAEIVMNDVANEMRHFSEKKLTHTNGHYPSSVLCMRLISNGEIIGVITVQSLYKYAYKKGQIEFLRTISIYVSSALANALLHESLQVNSTKKFKDSEDKA
ncbi:MAG: PAS domain-containing protein [Crocinitomix sp.]|nr:PAS domain-containing protein [Crocinitomix sp.]